MAAGLIAASSFREPGVESQLGRLRISSTSDFDSILRQLAQCPQLFQQPAHTALGRLMTYDGRLPVIHALDSLNDMEQGIVSFLADRPDLRLSPLIESPNSSDLFVFYNSLGRPHLRAVAEPPPVYEKNVTILPVGYLALPDGVLEQAAREQIAGSAAEASLRAEIDSWLGLEEAQGRLSALIDQVDDSVRHVEAVCIYVDDELFCVMEGCSTLIDRANAPGLLSRLCALPVREWTSSQRLAIFAFVAVFRTGRSIRFEEFNGKLLTARRLDARLQELYLTRP